LITGPELLTRNHILTEFDCGKQSLSDWLQRYALQNQAGDSARTYVLHRDMRVIGYYSVCPSSISRDASLARVLRGIGRHDRVPAILIARLALDRHERGQKLGAALLKYALLQAIEGADAIGGRVIIVHALDDEAKSFYEYFGFEPSPVADRTLMLLMKDARASMVN
jgi:GNAT superfamily N-acetyltransferase